MNLILLMLLSIVPVLDRDLEDHVELVELNSFHDINGNHVYDQVIFYEWAPDASRYHVRSWCLVEPRDLVDRRPMKRYSDGLYVVQWQDRDQNLMRTITATHYLRTWSQVDPERANKKLLDERARRSLTRRYVSRPPEPVPDETPMLEDWSGE